jgi:very-short-patch-repair endonuclease
LSKAGRDASLEGYQQGSARRVAELMEAIWNAIQTLDLSYAEPPASFEIAGQKIRTPSQIAQEGLATCLDTTTLFAACLEQAGIHPLLVLVPGHIFAGAWLTQDADFDCPVTGDTSALQKSLDLKEALFFETTAVTAQPKIRFEQAVAMRSILPPIECAIDLKPARMLGVAPVPLPGTARIASDLDGVHYGKGLGSSDWLNRFAAPASDGGSTPAAVPSAISPRLNEWQKKLLDLSSRNTLLNFKIGKRAIPIACSNAALLEDVLASGERLQILPPPQEALEQDDDSGNIARVLQYAAQIFADKKLIGLANEKELESRLLELMRSGKRDLEEGGANTLFLALGFLEWRDEKSRTVVWNRAPLVLVPIALDRKSARSRIILSGLDEEPRFNSTLLQLLEQDYGVRIPELENELPKDNSGLDVERIYQIVTQAVRPFAGWQVVPQVAISSFSFARYLMWKDLRENGELLRKNTLVKHLIDTPLQKYQSAIPFPQTRHLDQEFPPSKIFMPLPADSSQITAALAAATGKDFVLFGPPGTGKSQSIVNMISHCLAEGKKVLFVSAKKAALDVVHRRLKEVGLDDFCLEVHASKDSNRNAYEQLKRAASRVEAAVSEGDWNRETTQLLAQINALNNYVQHLHREYPNGLSAYRAMGKLLSSPALPRVALGWSTPDAHTRDDLEKMRASAQALVLAFPQNLDATTRATLAPVHVTEWSPSGEKQFGETVRQVAEQLRVFEDKRAAFLNALLPDSANVSVSAASTVCTALLKIAQLLLEYQGREAGVLFSDDAEKLTAELNAAQQTLTTLKSSWSALSCSYQEEAAATLDISALQKAWREAAAMMWPRRTFAQNAIERTLQTATAANQNPDPAQDIAQLQLWQKARRELAAFEHLNEKTFGLWRGEDTDIEKLNAEFASALELGREVKALVEPCAEDERARELLQRAVAVLLQDSQTAPVHEAAREIIEIFRILQPSLGKIGIVLGTPLREITDINSDGWLSDLATKCEAWNAAATHLRTWTMWQKERHNAEQLKLLPLVEALENGTLAPSQAPSVFEDAYLRWWLSSVVDSDAVLQSFSGAQQEFTATSFAKNVEKYLALTRRYVRARISAHQSTPTSKADEEAMGLLTREMKKKMRFKPLRKMMAQAANAILRLTPCLMMSPLSVAQFLALDEQLFDVVIFDEASQIPVWDSIGALARGRQAVIAGDPKQMPPTDFFSRSTEDEESESQNDLQSAESILDECLRSRVPELYLDWHYRSRYENLIAFSNHHYYDNRLVTFPAPQTKDSSVGFHYVADGIYATGKARHNENEAKAVVADVIAHLKAPVENGKKLSVGIVTFNSQQQKLIEDLLDAEKRADPTLEQWFSAEQTEPVMVKNLENVQGDERDICYFSVTFGPSIEGRLSMNFGPLNKDGGERRLNVAITRARHQLKVFSSLRPDQIDLSRTGAQGVKDFKHFLEFAQQGTASFAREAHPTAHNFDSCFEDVVCAALEKRGWRVQSQVGVAKFRIDLGVVHPDLPGRYLAAVECDGATYHSSVTARDRDKVRQEVLRGLGWNMLRVWSTDWWENPKRIADELDAQLKELHAKTPAPVAQPPEERSTPSALNVDSLDEETVTKPAIAATISVPTTAPITLSEEPLAPPISPSTPAVDLTPQVSSAPPKSNASTPAAEAAHEPLLAVYETVNLSEQETPPDASRFYDADYDTVLQDFLEKIVSQEGPLLEEILVRRIARAHGFARSGARIQKRLQDLMKSGFHISYEAQQKIFWPSLQAQESWRTFRKPGAGEARTVDEIPMPELCALARLANQKTDDPETAVRWMAKSCGLNRLTENARSRLGKAMQAITNDA